MLPVAIDNIICSHGHIRSISPLTKRHWCFAGRPMMSFGDGVIFQRGPPSTLSGSTYAAFTRNSAPWDVRWAPESKSSVEQDAKDANLEIDVELCCL